MTATQSAPTTDPWTTQLEQLRARYKHVRPPVLAALNILINDQNISVDDAKAQADQRGIRITAASLNAAKTLLSRMDDIPAPATAAKHQAPTTRPTPAPRRPRATDAPVDPETLIRGVVAKLQSQGNVETERLRDAMRKVIAVLQAAVG